MIEIDVDLLREANEPEVLGRLLPVERQAVTRAVLEFLVSLTAEERRAPRLLDRCWESVRSRPCGPRREGVRIVEGLGTVDATFRHYFTNDYHGKEQVGQVVSTLLRAAERHQMAAEIAKVLQQGPRSELR